jgi:2-(1,2-epoxy-1,2-dihydrophenyl)acetyl-CoA isomerase
MASIIGQAEQLSGKLVVARLPISDAPSMDKDFEDGLRVERIGAVCRLVIARPERHNTIDARLAERLLRVAAACDRDAAIRCVLLTGEGETFCSGGDVAAFLAAGDDAPRAVSEQTALLNAALSRLARMDKPLVTLVNGPAAGAGMGLAMLGDIVLVAQGACFRTGYTALGFTPDGGVSWLLPRLVGMRRAQELLLSNRRVDADEAVAIGLASRKIACEGMGDTALALACDLAAGATRAIGRTRDLLLSSLGNGFETHIELEARAIATACADADGREGVRAYIERRAPLFGA